MNTTENCQLALKLPKANRSKFNYLCKVNGSSMGAEINKFIAQYIEENTAEKLSEKVNSILKGENGK